MKDKMILGAGWKMHKTLGEARNFAIQLVERLPASPTLQVFVVAPFTVLWQLKEIFCNSGVMLGAQNMHWADEGPYTGEVSPKMLAEIGVDLVELGHSERRTLFGETDFSVNLKVKSALRWGLIPLVCVGESLEEKSFGVARESIARQVKIALHGIEPEQARRVWIAYEPVWAIGEAGQPAEPGYANDIQALIRQTLFDLYEPQTGSQIPILYGGSVNEANLSALLAQPAIDGLFIGRSSWQVDRFLSLLAIAAGA